MDEKQLAKLVKKTVAKANKPKTPTGKTYDPTLDATRRPHSDKDDEAAELFQQMKKREF
ncbi:MAG: hypothetical protein JWM41_4883 [Gemmatimonadetes bacterium]|jgi:hypothetical protein|nr:hypothetical protein [Gemmatimonadota bacterium]